MERAVPTLIFVHSPVAPAETWAALADIAERSGYAVRTPALTDALLHPMLGGPPFYPRCAEAIALAARGCARPILVAHSGAGLLIPLAATSMHDGPCGAIFVDAMLPQPGKSWFETAPAALSNRIRGAAQDGRVAPWHEWWPPGAIRSLFPNEAEYVRFADAVPRLPLAFFEESAPEVALPPAPYAYLRLSGGYDAEADVAAALGWAVGRANLDHIAMATKPAAVWRELQPLVDAMAPPID